MLTEALWSQAKNLAERRLTAGTNMSIDIVETYDEYEVAVDEIGKVKTTPEVKNVDGDMFKTKPVYFLLRSDSGELVATIAARYWDAPDDFTSFLRELYSEAYCPGRNAISAKKGPPAFAEIRGRLCYVGEFFISRPWRRKVSIGDMAMLAYCEAKKRWDPDWYWGFVRAKHAKMGLSIQYQGARTFPNAISWEIDTPYHRDADYFVCSRRDEIEWAMSAFTEEASAEIGDLRTTSKVGRPQLS